MKGPWIKFFPGDFLNGVADLDDGQRGAYITVLCLIYDRGGSIPDDAAWLARRIGVSKRKWSATRDQLLAMGKIQLDDNGMLTNRRAMKDLNQRGELSEKRSEAAQSRWKQEQGILPMETPENRQPRDANASKAPKAASDQQNDANRSGFGQKNGEKTRTFSARENGRENQETAQISHSENANADAIASPLARARVPEARYIDNNNDQNPEPTRARVREGPADVEDDLYALTLACCDAAGLSARIASRPALLTQSMDIVKGWQAAGIDVRATALPMIETTFQSMADPAHSLARFSAVVDTQHAKAKRHQQRNGTSLLPPATAKFDFDGEDQGMVAFRQALSKKVGPRHYAEWCRVITFEQTDWREPGDKGLLLVKGHATGLWTPGRVMEKHRQAILDTAKAVLGAQQAWER